MKYDKDLLRGTQAQRYFTNFSLYLLKIAPMMSKECLDQLIEGLIDSFDNLIGYVYHNVLKENEND